MDLNEFEACFRDQCGRIAERVTVVSKGRRIDDDGEVIVDGLIEPVNQFGFVIGLSEVNGHSGRSRRHQ